MNLTNMGEQPIYTTKAHIFQIDPETKRKWLPASSQAINVSYYYDNSRHTYRIISVEGTKAVINSTITPKMMIAKTSQKFGQWSDPRANTVYGLGFATEVELTKFIEKFEEIKELSREKQKSQILETNSVVGDVSSVSSSEGSENIAKLNKNTHNQKSASLGNVNDVGNCTAKESSVELRKSNSTNTAEGQLKYENDRLKLALAQSSSNAKKWEVELQTLKNNNVRLTTALQESNANVEEWKTQLASYKDECARLRRKVADIEQGQANAEHVHNQKMESTIGELAEKLRSVKIETKDKDSEINRLRNKLDELLPYESHNKKLLDRVAALEKDKEALKTNISKTQVDLESCRVEKTKERQKLLHLQRQVGLKLSELSAIHDEVTSNLQSQ